MYGALDPLLVHMSGLEKVSLKHCHLMRGNVWNVAVAGDGLGETGMADTPPVPHPVRHDLSSV